MYLYIHMRYSEHLHLAQMISILGPPPVEFLRRSEKSKLFWDEEGTYNDSACIGNSELMNFIGTWKGGVPIPATNFSDEESRLEGEEKGLFLVFMRKMLQWKPEDRKGIRDIIEDEWLLADLIEIGQVVRE